MTVLRLVDETDTEWRERARCRGMDPAIFYPTTRDMLAFGFAKNICARCPVRNECRDYAARRCETEGIWGGVTERELRRHRVELGERIRECNYCGRELVVKLTRVARIEHCCPEHERLDQRIGA